MITQHGRPAIFRYPSAVDGNSSMIKKSSGTQLARCPMTRVRVDVRQKGIHAISGDTIRSLEAAIEDGLAAPDRI